MLGSGRNFTWTSQDVLFNKRQYCSDFQMLKSGVVQTQGVVGFLVSSSGTGHHTNSPRSVRQDRLVGMTFVLLLSEPFDVLFLHTLERPLCHINQGGSECQAVFSVNPEASADTGGDLLGKKAAIFVAATFWQDLAS